MEHAIGDALSTASAAALSSLEDAQMTNQDASSPTSSLPYDLLLHLFKAVAALHDDSLEGKTATWSITSTATDLLSCSLVCRDWTLLAQQVLFHGVKLTSWQGISGFVETSIIKPDLAQKTLALSIDPDSFEMWNLCGALSPRTVEAVAACPNIRTLKVTSIAPSYAPALMQVIKSLRLLQNLLSSDDQRDPHAHELAHSTCWFIDLLKNVSTLRRLEFSFPLDYQHKEETLQATNLSSLAFQSTHHSAELHLLKSLGPQLLQLAYEQNDEDYHGSIPDQAAFVAWSSITHTLQQLRFDVVAYEDTNLEWFRQLLPQFQQLQRISFPTYLNPVDIIPSLPSTVEWLEIFVGGVYEEDHFHHLDRLRRCIDSLGPQFRVNTLVYNAQTKWWTLDAPEGSIEGRWFAEGYVEAATAKLARFEELMRRKEIRFIKCYPEICPPFFVDC